MGPHQPEGNEPNTVLTLQWTGFIYTKLAPSWPTRNSSNSPPSTHQGRERHPNPNAPGSKGHDHGPGQNRRLPPQRHCANRQDRPGPIGQTKPMPTEWAEGQALGFEVRVRPVCRTRKYSSQQSGKTIREYDAFTMEAASARKTNRTPYPPRGPYRLAGPADGTDSQPYPASGPNSPHQLPEHQVVSKTQHQTGIRPRRSTAGHPLHREPRRIP